jgi:hypothetical protein
MSTAGVRDKLTFALLRLRESNFRFDHDCLRFPLQNSLGDCPQQRCAGMLIHETLPPGQVLQEN